MKPEVHGAVQDAAAHICDSGTPLHCRPGRGHTASGVTDYAHSGSRQLAHHQRGTAGNAVCPAKDRQQDPAFDPYAMKTTWPSIF